MPNRKTIESRSSMHCPVSSRGIDTPSLPIGRRENSTKVLRYDKNKVNNRA